MSGVRGKKKPRKAFPYKIYGEAASNPRLGNLVRQLSPYKKENRAIKMEKLDI